MLGSYKFRSERTPVKFEIKGSHNSRARPLRHHLCQYGFKTKYNLENEATVLDVNLLFVVS